MVLNCKTTATMNNRKDDRFTSSQLNRQAAFFFGWDGDGRSDHVGIVEKCEDGLVFTIEGNSNDACMRRCYVVGS